MFVGIVIFLMTPHFTFGRFTGEVIGADVFQSEPEGVGLWTQGDVGVWIATDQHEDRSVFHLFERSSFRYIGPFTGVVTANTDGIAVVDAAVGSFSQGGVFAVHDDQGVSSFDWQLIREAILSR